MSIRQESQGIYVNLQFAITLLINVCEGFIADNGYPVKISTKSAKIL